MGERYGHDEFTNMMDASREAWRRAGTVTSGDYAVMQLKSDRGPWAFFVMTAEEAAEYSTMAPAYHTQDGDPDTFGQGRIPELGFLYERFLKMCRERPERFKAIRKAILGED